MLFVHAVFNTEKSCATAVQALVGANFAADQISALRVNRNGVEELELEHSTSVPKGAVLGALVGFAGGAVVLASGLVAGGPAYLALESVLAGGALGAVAGALGGLGFWKEKFRFSVASFENGAVLVGVCAEVGDIDRASGALRAAGATSVRTSSKDEAHASAIASVDHAPRI